MSRREVSPDEETARAFSTSWNTVGDGSVYTAGQFRDWMDPVDLESLAGKSVLEMGFGNGSLLHHFAPFRLARLEGVELGDTIETAERNLAHFPAGVVRLHRGDLTQVDLGKFDLVYCIGVLHHLRKPGDGFSALLRHVKPGAAFHCWVYAREGNFWVRVVVESVRPIASKLPWRVTKYLIALPLALPFLIWARLTAWLRARFDFARRLPLSDYAEWIAKREFRFFWHVAFDQLVTPQTQYIERRQVESWLADPAIDPDSRYIIFRNGNSWKFGGRLRR